MATDQRNILAFLGNDADFRTWGTAIAAQLAAVGLVQTADTGQINLTTVTRPAINTVGGYQIWRFNDAEQANFPIYLKIEYSIGGVADRPSLKVTLGTGSNGSGTLTGQLSTAQVNAAGASKVSTNVLPSYCSGGNGRFHLVTNLDQASNSYAIELMVERTATADGTPNSDGCLIVSQGGGGSSTRNKQVIQNTGTVPASTNHLAAIWHSADGQHTVAGANVAMFPGSFACMGKVYHTYALAYKHADIGELVSVSPVSYRGANHIYMPMGDGLAYVGNSGTHLAIPWE